MTQTAAGATGNQVATATAANTGAGELITLRAGAAGGGTPTGPVITTYTNGPGGLLTIDTNGSLSYPLADAHGDIVATTDPTGVLTANPLDDEFGKPETSGQPANSLGWLGDKERFTEASNGTIRMGERLYDPTLGRFLQVDPVQGGSANDYDYCNADPINCFDLAGTFGWSDIHKWAKRNSRLIHNAISAAQFGVFAFCVGASAGACAVAGGALAVASAAGRSAIKGRLTGRIAAAGAVDLALAAGGYGFGRFAEGVRATAAARLGSFGGNVYGWGLNAFYGLWGSGVSNEISKALNVE